MSTPSQPAGGAAFGLPDLATLTRMANELFRQLPGAELASPLAAQVDPSGVVASAAGLSGPGALGADSMAVNGGALSSATGASPLDAGSLARSAGAFAALSPTAISPSLAGVGAGLGAPVHVGHGPGAFGAAAATGSPPGLTGIAPPSAPGIALANVPAIAPPLVPGIAPGSAPTRDPASLLAFGDAPVTIPAFPSEAELDALVGLATMALSFGDPTSTPSSGSAPFGSTSALAQSSMFSPQLVPAVPTTAGPFDPYTLRRDFPILQTQVRGKPLIWLDNAATTQKPQVVIDRIAYFYANENSNIHRGAHTLAARATDAYEAARETVRRFLNASSTKDIVFVRGATEAINLVAQSWGRQLLGPGDELILTHLEHHSNIVPWQQLASQTGARIRVAPVDDSGQILLHEYERLFNGRTKLVALTQVSNALGTVTPAREMVAIAHRYGARALVDGAQSVSHMAVDVQALDADFFVFSGHKVFGPTGIGVLYGKPEVLEAMAPWQGGGNMIADVTFEKTVYHAAPMRFEAGTGNIADAVGLGAALEYLMRVGLHHVARYEHDLLIYATRRLQEVPGLRLIGTAPDKAGVLSFVLAGFETEQVGRALDADGIAVRSGHHCAQPALRRFGLESTVRPSLALYNTCEEIDALIASLLRLRTGRGAHG